MPVEFFTVSDELRISVERSNRGTKNCVLLHGFGEGSFVWDNFISEAGSDLNHISIDLRGHGNSDWDPQKRYNIETYISDINKIIKSLNLSEFNIIGHSLGADIAVEIAKRNPKQAISLILVDCSPSIDSMIADHIRDDFLAEHKIYESVSEFASALFKKRPLLTEHTALYIARNSLRASDGRYILKRDPNLIASKDWEKGNAHIYTNLRSITCPTLLLRGAYSAVLTKQTAERIASEIPSCNFQTVNMSGHSIMLENPLVFNNLVSRFISEVNF